jgi:hypothetical protein
VFKANPMGMVLPVMGVVTTDPPPMAAACAEGASTLDPSDMAARMDQKIAWVIERDNPNSGHGIERHSSSSRVQPRPPFKGTGQARGMHDDVDTVGERQVAPIVFGYPPKACGQADEGRIFWTING